MKRTLAIIVLSITALFAADKTTSKYGSGLLTRPMSFEDVKHEHYTKFNKVVDDLDTLFTRQETDSAALVGVALASITKSYVVVSDSLKVGTGAVIDSIGVSGVTAADSVFISVNGTKLWFQISAVE